VQPVTGCRQTQFVQVRARLLGLVHRIGCVLIGHSGVLIGGSSGLIRS